jgi:hypothetical protein
MDLLKIDEKTNGRKVFVLGDVTPDKFMAGQVTK